MSRVSTLKLWRAQSGVGLQGLSHHQRRRMAGCFPDGRDPRFVEHDLEGKLRQRIQELALGQADLISPTTNGCAAIHCWRRPAAAPMCTESGTTVRSKAVPSQAKARATVWNRARRPPVLATGRPRPIRKNSRPCCWSGVWPRSRGTVKTTSCSN